MSETFFPVNDLLRRKLQTSLVIATLTVSVASTLFILLFSARLGFGIATVTEGALTYGLSVIFSQFLVFLSILVFALGAIITSFIVFLMMKQRIRDFGLIKAVGCPNGLVFSYFLTELLLVTLAGCVLGALLGFAADFAAVNVFGFQTYQKAVNLWLVPAVFGVFLTLSLIFGARPLLAAARLSPVSALSPVQYFGMSEGGEFKALSRFGLILRISSRSLFRRQSASIRIIVLLSTVFVLLAVSICGGIVAINTTTSWVEDAGGKNIIAIAHQDMSSQYLSLLGKFFGATGGGDFNYIDKKLAVPAVILSQLEATPGIVSVDGRLVLMERVQEVMSYKIDPETLATMSVGGNRLGDSLVIGVDPEKMLTKSFMEGQFLNSSDEWTAVIGDTLAHVLYSPDLSADPPISISDPFLQNLIVHGEVFDIAGVRVDPLNNGNVTYVPLSRLQNATAISYVNIVFVKLDPSVDRSAVLTQLSADVAEVSSEFTVFELDKVLQESVAFLGSIWSPILLLPLFTLVSAAFCMIGYMLLAVDEQRQEFAVLRATGAKPKAITAILAAQSLIVLLSSWVVGISLGVIITLIILVPSPVVTTFTILLIAIWLFTALSSIILLSLYPAVKFARVPVLKIMS